MRRTVLIAALSTALAAVGPGLMLTPSAFAQSGQPVIADCQAHNELTHTYTIGQLQNALATLPATVKEYTNCYDAINTQLLKQSGTGGGTGSASGGGSGGSFLPTPVIIVLVILVLAAATFGALEVRRRRGE